MDEKRKLPRLIARREDLQYRIYSNNRQIEWVRAPGSSAQDKEQTVSNYMAENALYQAEVEEIDFVLDRIVENAHPEWSNRAYMLLLAVALVVALLALYGVVRAL